MHRRIDYPRAVPIEIGTAFLLLGNPRCNILELRRMALRQRPLIRDNAALLSKLESPL